MEEKPEKLHKRRIPEKKHFDINLTVLSPEPINKSIKLYKNKRKNQSSMSAPKIEKCNKFISLKDIYKNFYLDSFNSIKQNQIDLDIKRKVRLYLLYFMLI